MQVMGKSNCPAIGENFIVENAPEGIISVNMEGIVTSWNPAAAESFKCGEGDALGKNLNELIRLDGEENLFALLSERVKSGNNQLQKAVKYADGRVIHYEFLASSVLEGKNHHILIFSRDISTRQQNKEALLDAYRNQRIMNSILNVSLLPMNLEEQLEMILELILSIPTIKLMPSGAILLVEDKADELVLKVQRGFSDKQLATCHKVPFGKCHCGRAASSAEAQFIPQVDDEQDLMFEDMKGHGHYCLPIRNKDVVQGVIALYIEEGHQISNLEIETLNAIANVVSGIIERDRMEMYLEDHMVGLQSTIKELDKSRDFNESVIASMASGLMVLDSDGRIEKTNPVVLEMLGLKEERDISGYKLDQILESDVGEILTNTSSREDAKRYEFEMNDGKGRRKIIEYMTVPWKEEGKDKGLIINFKDVTEYRKIQAEMEKMNHLSIIAEIASSVAHEVRNPLAGIRTMSQAIDEQIIEGDEKKEYIGRIIRQVDRLNVILTDFFTYARPPKPQVREVALVKIVDEIRPFILNRMVKCGIELEEDFPKNLPDIRVDPNQIQQVFLNLMLNSVDAIGQNGFVSIKAEYIGKKRDRFGTDKFPWLKEDSSYVMVTLIDSGGGMPPEVVERVFEPFFTTKHNGSGLGMAIVFRILKENNAGIFVESNPPNGSTFIIFFRTN